MLALTRLWSKAVAAWQLRREYDITLLDALNIVNWQPDPRFECDTPPDPYAMALARQQQRRISPTLLERFWNNRVAMPLLVPFACWLNERVSFKEWWLNDVALMLYLNGEVGIPLRDAWRILRYTSGTELDFEEIACHRYFQIWRQRGDHDVPDEGPSRGVSGREYQAEYDAFRHLFP